MESSELLTPSEAGVELGISASAVRLIERQGRLSSVRDARGWRFYRREDVLALAAERRKARPRRVTPRFEEVSR